MKPHSLICFAIGILCAVFLCCVSAAEPESYPPKPIGFQIRHNADGSITIDKEELQKLADKINEREMLMHRLAAERAAAIKHIEDHKNDKCI